MKKLVSILSICLVLGSVIINFNNSGSITIENPSLQIDLNKDATEISNLVITNDDDFVVLAISEGWDGNGTSELPFIIENYMFTDNTIAVSISDTSVSFDLRNCSGFGVITFNNVSNGMVRFCDFRGIELYRSWNCGLEENIITSSKEDGINVFGSHFFNISGNRIENSGSDHLDHETGCGIRIFASTHLRVTNNTVTNSYYTGIFVHSSSYGYFKDNIIRNNGHSYITTIQYTCTYTTYWSDCTWTETRYVGAGFNIESSHHLDIISTSISDNAEAGFYIEESGYLLIHELEIVNSLIEVRDSESIAIEESNLDSLRIIDTLEAKMYLNHISDLVNFARLDMSNISHCILEESVEFYNCQEDHILNSAFLTGFSLRYCTDFVIHNNQIGIDGIQFDPESLQYINHDFSNNSINGKQILVLIDVIGESYVYEDIGQMILFNSEDCSFQIESFESSFLMNSLRNCSIIIQHCPQISIINSYDCSLFQSNITILQVDSCVRCSFEELYVKGGRIRIAASSNVDVKNSTMYNAGISLSTTIDGEIIGNRIIGGNCYGISTYKVEGLTIRNNSFIDLGSSDCTSSASIFLSGRNCTIIFNMIRNTHGYGILIYNSGNFESTQNAIYGNQFFNNTAGHARDDGRNNEWDDGIALGNFWDDYDGKGAYYISGTAGSFDMFPNGHVPSTGEPNLTIINLITILITTGSVSVIIALGLFIIAKRRESNSLLTSSTV